MTRWDRFLDTFFNAKVMAKYLPDILSGVVLTIELALAVIVAGLLAGLILALIRSLGIRPVNWLIIFVVDVFRSLPPLVVIVRVTGTVTELVLDLTTTEPAYVPAAKVPALTETLMDPGVVPLVEPTESHEAAEVESLKLVVVPLLTDKVCDDGRVPPC